MDNQAERFSAHQVERRRFWEQTVLAFIRAGFTGEIVGLADAVLKEWDARWEKNWRDAKFDDACWPGMRRLPREEFLSNCSRFHECLERTNTVRDAEKLYEQGTPR